MDVQLDLPDDELASCVACGLCLPHCPTWRVTGEETASPRGRLAAMRAVQWEGAAVDEEFRGYMDACVLCRGCEAACPSGVPFGHLMVATREAVARQQPASLPKARRWLLPLLAHPRLLAALTAAGAVAQRLHLMPRRLTATAGLPVRLPLRKRRLRPSGDGRGADDVWLFTGCVMDAWQRPTHAAVMAMVEAAGAKIALPGPAAACCGALHEHGGLGERAGRLAQRTMSAFAGSAPILVDSAGCGAALKGYGELLGTDEARAFSARVLDVHEWLAARADRLPPPVAPIDGPVAVQDPCHLRHVQRTHTAVRTVLAPYAALVELDDEGLCCGAGGAYATEQAELAAAIRERKVAAVERSGARVVASANPGCLLHLRAAGLDVRHPCELMAEAAGLLGMGGNHHGRRRLAASRDGR